MNKKNTVLVLAAVGLVGVLALPLLAGAQAVSTPTTTSTLSELQAQVAALLSQLASLQAQIRQVESSSTSTPPGDDDGGEGHGQGMPMPTSTMMDGTSTHPLCIGFQRNLSLGSTGSDVSDLQSMLAQDPSVYPSGAVTGFFGPLTAKAVTMFQEKNDIATSSSGFFGPITRDFLTRRCGGPGPVRLPGGWNPTSTPSGTPPVMMHPFMPQGFINGTSSEPTGTRPMPPPPPGNDQ